MSDNQIAYPTLPRLLGNISSAKSSVNRVIDITDSSTVPVHELRRKLDLLQIEESNDAGLPVISHGALVGLMPADAAESALKEMEEIINSKHLLSDQIYGYSQEGATKHSYEADLTSYIDKVRLCPSYLFKAYTITHFT